MFKEFKGLGYTDKETKIYLCLIMLGESDVQQIREETNLLRTSVYSVLKRLIEKGLVFKTKKKRSGRQVEYFAVKDTSVLVKNIQQQRQSLADKEALARDLISRIKSQSLVQGQSKCSGVSVCQTVQAILPQATMQPKEHDSIDA